MSAEPATKQEIEAIAPATNDPGYVEFRLFQAVADAYSAFGRGANSLILQAIREARK